MEFNPSHSQPDFEQTQADGSIPAIVTHNENGPIIQGMIASDRDILNDLRGIFDQPTSADGGCGCSSGCSCGDCRCLSGRRAVEEETEEELNSRDSRATVFDSTAMQETIRDLLMGSAGDTTQLESLLDTIKSTRRNE